MYNTLYSLDVLLLRDNRAKNQKPVHTVRFSRLNNDVMGFSGNGEDGVHEMSFS